MRQVMIERIHSITALTDKMKLDVMIDDRWKGQVVFPSCPGLEYSYEELKAFARMKKPSLVGKEFDLIPSGKPIFRD